MSTAAVAQQQDGDDYKPDLSAEVAMLSTKLVNAINYQTNLDDSLQATRHELDRARQELSRVSQQKAVLDEHITNGILVKKAHVDVQIAKLREELRKERVARDAAEKAKKQTEGELENLTTALFEEANGMVAAARKDTEAATKRNSQLRSQLGDTEVLLASQQEQLQDLKGVMERMERASSEHDNSGHRDASVPSTPINSTTAAWDALQFSPNGAGVAEVPPNHPLHFSQLLIPMMRNDITAYTDFQELLAIAQRAAPHSRGGSGSVHNLASASQPDLRSASSPALPGAFSFAGGLGLAGSSSANNSPNTSTFGSAGQSAPPLKESRFYKRTLTEDIEPTLRLDIAPGLSFLSRRTVLSSLLSGSLVVEPFMPSTKFYGPVFACALCGESRKNEPYVRKHRFRTSESEDAQRYPLCDYCLSRIRAAGDFVGFLRMVRDGHWRCESDEEAKGAWEEATRLRERMFWARIGGGVVPAVALGRPHGGAGGSEGGSPSTTAATRSARHSLESIPERSAREHAEAASSSVREVKEIGRSGMLGEPRGRMPEAASSSPELPQPVPRPAGPKSTSALGRAIVGASSGVLATGRPDVSPQRATEEAESTAIDAPTSVDETGQPDQTPAESNTEVEQDEVPLNIPVHNIDGAAEQSELDEQLQQDLQRASLEDEPSKPDTELQVPHKIPIVNEPTPASTPSNDTDRAPSPVEPQPAPPVDRRPSGVMARVKAMEAQAQGSKSLPGAFD